MTEIKYYDEAVILQILKGECLMFQEFHQDQKLRL